MEKKWWGKERARRLLRGMPGPRDSQTFQLYFPGKAVEDKVGCHTFVVTDVTDRAGHDMIDDRHFSRRCTSNIYPVVEH